MRGHHKHQSSVLTTPLQSPQLPDGGSVMAVYDKSGYSHSETSLVAVIYMSSQVRLLCQVRSRNVPTVSQFLLLPSWPAGGGHLPPFQPP